ncbi:MAG: hypothetical protein ACLFUJ_02965 [Phycisphaerae bacterium]
MALTEQREVRSQLELAEQVLRQTAKQAVEGCLSYLNSAEALTRKHGKTALQTQMGDDAAEFANAYTDLRSIVATYLGQTAPALSELPADPVDPEAQA